VKMKTVLICLAVATLACALASERNVKSQFHAFTQKYNKVYGSPAELERRMAIFENNLKTIDEMNKNRLSARYGVTKFADLTSDEFRAQYLMKESFVGPTNPEQGALGLNAQALPTNFDWRNTKNIVTPVYDQGACGSCWAFSATEAIESQWALAGHSLASLSPQQIVDCDVGNGDLGCNGGDTPTAYEYVIKAGGMETQSAYPYTGADGNCKFKKSSVVATISNWTYVTTTKDESQMQAGLVAKGPLSICVEADSWQFYMYGVITDFCGNQLDHCVLITGYQDYQDWDGITYPVWNIRNSWGGDWGESGYVFVERGYDLCGVADEVTLPQV